MRSSPEGRQASARHERILDRRVLPHLASLHHVSDINKCAFDRCKGAAPPPLPPPPLVHIVTLFLKPYFLLLFFSAIRWDNIRVASRRQMTPFRNKLLPTGSGLKRRLLPLHVHREHLNITFCAGGYPFSPLGVKTLMEMKYRF